MKPPGPLPYPAASRRGREAGGDNPGSQPAGLSPACLITPRGFVPFQVIETGVLGLKVHLHRADGPVALLAHDDLGDTLVFGGVLAIDLVPVDEHDDIGVLLDGA